MPYHPLLPLHWPPQVQCEWLTKFPHLSGGRVWYWNDLFWLQGGQARQGIWADQQQMLESRQTKGPKGLCIWGGFIGLSLIGMIFSGSLIWARPSCWGFLQAQAQQLFMKSTNCSWKAPGPSEFLKVNMLHHTVPLPQYDSCHGHIEHLTTVSQ